jgi:hypothetical protein
MQLQCAFLQIHLLSISSLSNPYCLMPLLILEVPNHSKISKNVSARSCFYGVCVVALLNWLVIIYRGSYRNRVGG